MATLVDPEGCFDDLFAALIDPALSDTLAECPEECAQDEECLTRPLPERFFLLEAI